MRQVYLGTALINDVFLGADRMDDLFNLYLDPDAQSFFNATGITNLPLKLAVNQFVLELKGELLWDKMTQILPFVADNTASLSTQFAYNLKNTASFNPTLVNGTTNSDLGGYQANKTTPIYINTNLVPHTEFVNNGHVCVYTTDAVQSTGQADDTWDWGINPANGSGSIMIVGRFTPDGFGDVQKIANLASNTNVFVGANPAAGCYISSFFNVSNTSTTEYMENGVLIGSSTGSYRRPDNGIEAYFGATNQPFVSPSAQARSNRKYQLLTVGSGLTNTEMVTLNTIVNTFQANIDAAMGTSRAV
jgi:hypothetical protein